MPLPPFDSPDSLRRTFVAGLERLLDHPALGGLILVLANAGMDPDLRRRLGVRLSEGFQAHLARCRDLLARGRDPEDAPDDLLVFLKLALLGEAGCPATERRREGPWELQFNLLRAFRPKRMSAGAVTGMQAPFRDDGFHFNRPFLRAETFWTGKLLGRNVDLLYNKFPFADLHGLLVPEREARLPQFLTREWHAYAWELVQALAPTLPGLGLGYNSYGAYASVNHLHFQSFLRDRPLPVQDPCWRHNGGGEDYPARCYRLGDPGEAWKALDWLHGEEMPYNLIYLPGQAYCLPRVRQGLYRHAPWAGGHAWYEMAGGVVSFRRDDYRALDVETIAAELRRVGA